MYQNELDLGIRKLLKIAYRDLSHAEIRAVITHLDAFQGENTNIHTPAAKYTQK